MLRNLLKGKGARKQSRRGRPFSPRIESLEQRQMLATNVILMISDGIGFNGWEAARYYEDGLPYDDDGFAFYGMSTYMKNTVDPDTGELIWSKGEDGAAMDWVGVDQGYDPEQMWSEFNYHRGDSSGDYYKFTDSAAAATAMYTGQKTYNSAISYSVDGQDLTTIAEIAAGMGKATGAVSSVQFSHATPACVDAHTNYRYNKTEIASQMLNSDLDVIMGGDAYVDTEGEYPGAVAGWKSDAQAAGFTIVDQNYPTDWTDLADMDGSFRGGAMPAKVAGLFDGSTLDGRAKPTLEEMTKGALDVLQQDTDGMFLMVEGGAVDWQNHANNIDLMYREQVDFDNSVQAVMDWIEADNGSNWDNTLLIVTSDHETGGIWGPNTVIDDNGTPDDHGDDTVNPDWQKVVKDTDPDTPGNQPGVQYTTGGHTNALVPLWAKGDGAALFDELIAGNDATADQFWSEAQGWNWNGDYVDNTAVFHVMDAVVSPPSAELVDSTLQIRGGSGNDNIHVRRSPWSDTISVSVNGMQIGRFSQGDVDLIDLDAKTGNDRVRVGTFVMADTLIRGGSGNDRIHGAVFGNNILVGGDGADKLKGGFFDDVLIGGDGRDHLMGRFGQDLLIGGETAYDANDAALLDIMSQWSGPGSYWSRVDGLRSTLNDTTVLDDGVRDRLFGGWGRDWFFDGVRDKSDARFWEKVDPSGMPS